MTKWMLVLALRLQISWSFFDTCPSFHLLHIFFITNTQRSWSLTTYVLPQPDLRSQIVFTVLFIPNCTRNHVISCTKMSRQFLNTLMERLTWHGGHTAIGHNIDLQCPFNNFLISISWRSKPNPTESFARPFHINGGTDYWGKAQLANNNELRIPFMHLRFKPIE